VLGGLLPPLASRWRPRVVRADAASDFEQLIAAAKKEGTLQFYNAQTGFPEPVLMMQAFEAKYGIKVEKTGSARRRIDGTYPRRRNQ